MKTEDLIARLGREGAAVTPLPPPSVRTLTWLLGAVVYLVVMTPLVAMMMEAAVPRLSPLFVAQQLGALATGAFAAYVALSSVVPGYRASWRPLAAAAAAWAVLLAIGMGRDLQALGSIGAGAETDWPCVALMTAGGAILVAPLVVMLRRGAPFTPRGTAWLGGLGALSIASIEACLARPHAYTATIVIWHGATLAALALALAWSGRILLHPRDRVRLGGETR